MINLTVNKFLLFLQRVLYIQKLDLSGYIDTDRIVIGEGRGECGLALHLPLRNYVAGSDPTFDYHLMITVANDLLEFLLYKRARRGPENWDYNPEKAVEVYNVCGDNVSTSGIIIEDKNYPSGAKLQIFLDKTFGVNEVAIRWKAQMVGDEFLLSDYAEYLKRVIKDGTFASER